MADPPYGVIANRLIKGKVIPFLGAGASMVSRPSGSQWSEGEGFLPNGRELSHLLADETSFPCADPEEMDDLAKVASYYAVVNGRPLLRDRLHELLDHDYAGGSLHSYLAARDYPQVIVSTNYDTLLEQAFADAGKPYHLVVYPCDNQEYANAVLWWSPGAAEPEPVPPNELFIDLEQETVIFKMHGTVDRGGGDWDNYVVTEEDYIDFLSRMTANTAIPAIFFDHFRERSFLFLGYGLRDWNLRVILKNLSGLLECRGKGQRFPSWAIQKSPSELECRLWESREVSVFDLTADEFVENLQERQRD